MKITRNPEETICSDCGVLTVAWEEQAIVNRRLEEVQRKRDYYPVSFVIRLKPDTKTTYIVEPELEKQLRTLTYSRIRSLNDGKLDYSIDVPLPKDLTIGNLLDIDSRIEEWHTETSAPACETHTAFVGSRW